jgi:hypothetical protein
MQAEQDVFEQVWQYAVKVVQIKHELDVVFRYEVVLHTHEVEEARTKVEMQAVQTLALVQVEQ